MYEHARTCANDLGEVRRRVELAVSKLIALYPEAATPPVSIVIGRNTSAGTTKRSGVIIGLERACSADFLQPNTEDRLVHLIAHEYAHIQQPPYGLFHRPTVLDESLKEGVAELVAEITSGEASESYIATWVRGREQEVLCRFARDRNSTDTSHWLYNGVGTKAAPGDLGYWVGYAIAKKYLQQSSSPRAALKTLLAGKDSEAVFIASVGAACGT